MPTGAPTDTKETQTGREKTEAGKGKALVTSRKSTRCDGKSASTGRDEKPISGLLSERRSNGPGEETMYLHGHRSEGPWENNISGLFFEEPSREPADVPTYASGLRVTKPSTETGAETEYDSDEEINARLALLRYSVADSAQSRSS